MFRFDAAIRLCPQIPITQRRFLRYLLFKTCCHLTAYSFVAGTHILAMFDHGQSAVSDRLVVDCEGRCSYDAYVWLSCGLEFLEPLPWCIRAVGRPGVMPPGPGFTGSEQASQPETEVTHRVTGVDVLQRPAADCSLGITNTGQRRFRAVRSNLGPGFVRRRESQCRRRLSMLRPRFRWRRIGYRGRCLSRL